MDFRPPSSASEANQVHNGGISLPQRAGSEPCQKLSLSHAKPVGHTVNVVEPAGNEVHLEDRLIVKPDLSQAPEVVRSDLRRARGQLGSVIQHGPLLLGKRCLAVIPPQRGGKFLVQRDATEELGVALDSVKAAIEGRNHRRNHFMIAAP
jgi:hypothetical protein